MATLVLTTVGGAVGGPIGAALGGILGQAVDRSVLAPKARQGPRLTELKVQTSSYGSPIPLQFGTMRVAGTVIWSTDLIESRSTSGAGKGQPKTTTYSYRASFAVLLSARAILGLGRIWADGNLLRGAAGDFKVATGFRLHPGGEAQAVDPLIAALEGAGAAPAHRGCAYAVFEDLQLADFGNRIPSLTFEVIADAGPVAIGAVAEAVSDGLVAGEAAAMVAGFSAYGDSVRGVLETLADAGGAWFASEGGAVRMLSAADAPVEVADAGVSAKAGGRRRVRAIAAADSAPRVVTLAYYDPEREYQAGLQRARRPGAGNREQRIDLAAALSATQARALAEEALARAGTARERRTVALGVDALALAPGGCVTIAGEGGTWRIVQWSLEAMVLTLDLERIARAAVSVPTSSGRVLATPDLVPGRTVVRAFELPALGDELLASPRLLIAAAGEQAGWRRASLLVSTDGGASWTNAGTTAAPAVIGTVTEPPGVGAAAILDLANAIEVMLPAWADLDDADAAGLDRGANLALVGDELVQFGSAVPLGDGRWRLSRLLRGRRGTEVAIGAQAAGDRFVLLESDALASIDLPVAAIGSAVRVLASGVGDGDGPAAADAVLSGVSVRPPAPVHLTARALESGDVEISWVRRSRNGWRWIEGAEAPIGEERESYRSAVEPVGGGVRTVETAVPRLVIDAAERAGGPVRVTVRQVGTNGESPPATIVVPA